MVGEEHETISARTRRIIRQRRAWLMETAEQIVAGPTEPPRLVATWRLAVVALLALDVAARLASYGVLRDIRGLLELPR